VNLVSPLAKQSGDLFAGLMLFKADLRLLVEPATQGNKLRLVNLQGFNNGCVIFVIPVLCLHDTFEFMRVRLSGALFCFILTEINECFSYISVMTKNNGCFLSSGGDGGAAFRRL
jgi:hypothetical protein